MGFLSLAQIEDVESQRSTGAYLRASSIETGTSVKIRMLGEAISGWGGWRGGVPIRFETKPSAEEFDVTTLDLDKGGKKGVLRLFIAIVVWNYTTESLQIFEFNQVSIQDKIFALIKNEDDWGDITTYDISITKTMKGELTTYDVQPSPKGKGTLAKEIEKAFDETYINLKALYSNENPFEDKSKKG